MGLYPQQFFKKPDTKLMALTASAIGVVYGDIGTSPLYAINEIFFGHNFDLSNPQNILGPISLVIWALTLIVSFKYLSFVLKADNDGEGGVFALYSRLHQFRNRYVYYLKILLLLAAGLIVGEGIITPAISVMSAVEGLAVYNSDFAPRIIPIVIFILTLLFMFQSKGTNSLGKVFGIFAFFWFLMIGSYGAMSILETPQILQAINPLWAFQFLFEISAKQALFVFGSVILVVTGGESIFADMGHFGKKPIRLGWFSFVYPALMLNYLGQGAFLLSGREVFNKNIFFSMIPKAYLLPSVILATCAAVIASQALISGAFSLGSQAVALGLFPRIRITQTHSEHVGQIYVGLINWILYFGSIFLVLIFKNSTSLASAYGMSLSFVMFTTTLAMVATSFYIWRWDWGKILLVFVPIAWIEFSFLIAKTSKFFEGGYIPLTFGLCIFVVIRIWKWGRKATFKAYSSQNSITIREMIELKNNQHFYIDKNVVLLVPKPLRSIDEPVPPLVQLFYNRYGVFPKNLFLVEVVHRKTPYIHGPRHESFLFYQDDKKGTVASTTIHFGFMEEPNLELVLEDLAISHQIELPADPHKWLIHTAQEKLIAKPNMSIWEKLRFRVFVFLRQVTMPAHFYYGLGNNVNLSVDILPIKLD